MMKNEYTAEDVIERIKSELKAGKKTRAKAIIMPTTNIGTKGIREVLDGRRQIQLEEIINTDLDNLNKWGCSTGAAALILVSLCLVYIFI